MRLHPVPGGRIHGSACSAAPRGSRGAETRSRCARGSEVCPGLFLSAPACRTPDSLRDSFLNPPPPHRASPVCRWDPGSEGSGTFSGHTSPGSFWGVLSASGRECVPGPQAVLGPRPSTRGLVEVTTCTEGRSGCGGGRAGPAEAGSPPPRPRPPRKRGPDNARGKTRQAGSSAPRAEVRAQVSAADQTATWWHPCWRRLTCFAARTGCGES